MKGRVLSVIVVGVVIGEVVVVFDGGGDREVVVRGVAGVGVGVGVAFAGVICNKSVKVRVKLLRSGLYV